MKSAYRYEHAVVNTDALSGLCPLGAAGTIYVMSVSCPPRHRGKGWASRAMEMMCADADAEGVALSLIVSTDDLNDEWWVTAFYERLGFRYARGLGGGAYMIRQPGAPRRRLGQPEEAAGPAGDSLATPGVGVRTHSTPAGAPSQGGQQHQVSGHALSPNH